MFVVKWQSQDGSFTFRSFSHRFMLSVRYYILLLSLSLTRNQFVDTLNNGLALTPPMGWMSWGRFRCNVDCGRFPTDCLSEKLIKQMADATVLLGLKDVGYEYIVVDDCWMASSRDKNDYLQPDPQRFPSGMKALVDYVHKKGLKFGIYADFGLKTCAGYPGSLYYLERDAQTFAHWTVDYVKFDACNSDPALHPRGFAIFGHFLNQTGRRMVYSCSYPAYGEIKDHALLVETCNLWRRYKDIQDSWISLKSIMEHWSKISSSMWSGPGHWNDPDMLQIGNYGLSKTQQRIQIGIWSILAAPLMISTDLRQISNDSLNLLKNPYIIAINQDRLGKEGNQRIVPHGTSSSIWVRRLVNDSFVIAGINLREDCQKEVVKINLRAIIPQFGLENSRVAPPLGEFKWKFGVFDSFTNQFLFTLHRDAVVTMTTIPNDIVMWTLR